MDSMSSMVALIFDFVTDSWRNSQIKSHFRVRHHNISAQLRVAPDLETLVEFEGGSNNHPSLYPLP